MWCQCISGWCLGHLKGRGCRSRSGSLDEKCVFLRCPPSISSTVRPVQNITFKLTIHQGKGGQRHTHMAKTVETGRKSVHQIDGRLIAMIQVVNRKQKNRRIFIPPIAGLLVCSSQALTPLLRENNTRSPSTVVMTTFLFASKFTLPLMIWRQEKGQWYCPPLAQVSMLGRTIPATLLQSPQTNSSIIFIMFVKSFCLVPNNQLLIIIIEKKNCIRVKLSVPRR